MSRRPRDLVLSAAGYLGFIAVVVWTMAFLADHVVPRSVDRPERLPIGLAVAVDLALLLFFVVQHSVMARPQVKSFLRRRIPERLERTTYVLATDVCMLLLLALWQPWGGRVWQLTGPGAAVLWSLCAAGWLLAIASTFAVDHLELTGLRQASWAAPGDRAPTRLQVDGLHAVVRHPLMTGLLVAFWATPRMGASHLLFAATVSVYVAIGMRFEERDLRRAFGAAYADYARHVPALFPHTASLRRALDGRSATTASAPRGGAR